MSTKPGSGERPQAIVPKGAWHSARSAGAWTLVGCTVSPAFDFAGFKLAPEGFRPGRRAAKATARPPRRG